MNEQPTAALNAARVKVTRAHTYDVQGGQLHADLGLGRATELPDAEVQRRWQANTPQWPIMNAVLHGMSRDQMMAKHQANHIQVAYAPDETGARPALEAKGTLFAAMGLQVRFCGVELSG